MSYKDYNNYNEQDKLSLAIDKLDTIAGAIGGGGGGSKTVYTLQTTASAGSSELTAGDILDRNGNSVENAKVINEVLAGTAELALFVPMYGRFHGNLLEYDESTLGMKGILYEFAHNDMSGAGVVIFGWMLAGDDIRQAFMLQ